MSSPPLSDWLLSAARTVNGAPGCALLEKPVALVSTGVPVSARRD